MEFRRATMDEQPDEWLIERHEREIVPAAPPAGRLRRGARLPAVRRRGRRRRRRRARLRLLQRLGAVAVAGRVPQPLRRDLGLDPRLGRVRASRRPTGRSGWCGGRWPRAWAWPTDRPTVDGSRMREQRSGLEYLRSVAEIRERGVHVSLRAYETRVFWELRELYDAAGVWGRLAERLGGRGVPSLEGALRELQLAPVHDALRAVIAAPPGPAVERLVARRGRATGTSGDSGGVVESVAGAAARAEPVIDAIDDPVAGGGAARCGRCSRRWGPCRSGARPGRRAGRGSRSSGWRRSWPTRCGAAASTRRAAWWAAERVRLLLDLPLPSAVGGRGRRPAAAGWSTRGWPTRSSARSCGSTAGTTRSGSTASRGSSSSPGPTASSAS